MGCQPHRAKRSSRRPTDPTIWWRGRSRKRFAPMIAGVHRSFFLTGSGWKCRSSLCHYYVIVVFIFVTLVNIGYIHRFVKYVFVPFRAASSTEMDPWHETGHVLFPLRGDGILLSGAPHLAEDLEVESPDSHVIASEKPWRFECRPAVRSSDCSSDAPHRRLQPLLSRVPWCWMPPPRILRCYLWVSVLRTHSDGHLMSGHRKHVGSIQAKGRIWMRRGDGRWYTTYICI